LTRSAAAPAARLPGQRSIGGGANMEHHLNSYSYMWWTNGRLDSGVRVLPDAPADTFCAIGHAGHKALIVIPSLEIVICWTEGWPDEDAHQYSERGRVLVNRALALFMGSLIAGGR
jgi:hypothetical protein